MNRSLIVALHSMAMTLVLIQFAGAQPADLTSDLAKLNVRHRTQHYAIAGTVSDERLAEYGRCLEYIYSEYAKGFSELLGAAQSGKGKSSREKADDETGAVGDRKDGSKSTGKSETLGASNYGRAQKPSFTLPGVDGSRFPVIVYAKDAEYSEFSDKYFSGSLEHTLGAYMPTLKLLIIRDNPDSNETYETLFHEAFHQFADEHVPFIPMWLNEGLATYYGTARVTKNGGLAFDRPDNDRFHVVRRYATDKQLIPLQELMLYDRAEFYSPWRIQLCYSQSYTLVAYILTNQAGAAHMRRYIKDLATAKTPQDVEKVTRQHFDAKRLDSMVNDWLAYCHRH